MASSLVFSYKIEKDTSQMLLGNCRVCTVRENGGGGEFKVSSKVWENQKIFMQSGTMFSLTKSGNFYFS